LGRDHDVIIVGANVAGATTAYEMAIRGLRVGLVERRKGKEVGERSCGDGIETFQFKKLGLEIPQGDFILRSVTVGYLTSPDGRTRLRGDRAGIAIDRYGLNQHLLERAMGAGVELIDEARGRTPLVEGTSVVGVRCQKMSGGETFDLHAPVTVDATGWRGMLRRSLPAVWPVAEVVRRREMAVAYREERLRPNPVDEFLVEATMDYDRAPQGLYWVADRTEVLVNVGIGMQWVPDLPNPRRVVRDYVVPRYPGLTETSLIRSGAGIIPNRRPIDCPVATGFMAVGDAACQVQPLSGSGIGSSMYAARLAAETVKAALETTRTPSMEDLFPYVHAYHTSYGIDQAVNQILRVALQSLNNVQLNRLLAARIVSEEELLMVALKGRLDLNFVAKLKAAAKLLGEPRIIKRLARMHSNMEAARRIYKAYPTDLNGLADWRRRVAKLFSRV
jgi:geranylgeranyl reductase family protein